MKFNFMNYYAQNFHGRNLLVLGTLIYFKSVAEILHMCNTGMIFQ